MPPTKILRVIARLNIGGPSIQAIDMTTRLREHGFETHLVSGIESADEGNMLPRAADQGLQPTRLQSMRKEFHPRDIRALVELVRIIRRERPVLIHTHLAKAGALTRAAAILAFPIAKKRPVLIHTFHGHTLHSYFNDRTTRVFRGIERQLAKRCDAIVAVSPIIRDELLELGVGTPEKLEVIRLGFDLEPFLRDADRAQRREAIRKSWGVGEEELVVLLVARIVPIKRVDRFLRVMNLLDDQPNLRGVVTGDGELGEQIRSSDEAKRLGDRVIWAGFSGEMADVYAASDIVVLCSDNEGTPVSLIEAGASGLPVVTTDVGGVSTVVSEGVTGYLTELGDDQAFAEAIRKLAGDPERRKSFGEAGRELVLRKFQQSRLSDDLADLYRRLLAAKGFEGPDLDS